MVVAKVTGFPNVVAWVPVLGLHLGLREGVGKISNNAARIRSIIVKNSHGDELR